MLAIVPRAHGLKYPPALEVFAQVVAEFPDLLAAGLQLARALLAQSGQAAVDRGGLALGVLGQHMNRGAETSPAAVDALLLDVGEEGRHLVKVLRLEGVEFMVVALRATQRRTKPDAGKVHNTVGSIFGEILLGLRSSLVRHAVQTVVGACHKLLLGRIRE